MKLLGALLAICLLALPLSAQTYNTYTAQVGVTLFTGQAATATAASGAIRLPNFSGAGVLTIVETGITGSPSGCTLKLAYEPNNVTTAGSTVSTTSFTPATGTQVFTIAPSQPSGDNYVAAYACSSAYPTAGVINATFSPFATEVLANVSGSGDPCANANTIKSSVAVAIVSATTTQLVALSAAKAIYVCGFTAQLGLSETAKLEYGTGTNCGTGTTALTGAFASDAAVIAASFNLDGSGAKVTAPAGTALCLVSTGTAAINGVVSYVQQ
jgi:hypothetical protein